MFALKSSQLPEHKKGLLKLYIVLMTSFFHETRFLNFNKNLSKCNAWYYSGCTQWWCVKSFSCQTKRLGAKFCLCTLYFVGKTFFWPQSFLNKKVFKEKIMHGGISWNQKKGVKFQNFIFLEKCIPIILRPFGGNLGVKWEWERS